MQKYIPDTKKVFLLYIPFAMILLHLLSEGQHFQFSWFNESYVLKSGLKIEGGIMVSSPRTSQMEAYISSHS